MFQGEFSLSRDMFLDGTILDIEGKDVHLENINNGLNTVVKTSSKIGSATYDPINKVIAISPSKINSNDIEIWDIISGKLLNKFQGSHYYIDNLSFSPCGQFLLSSSRVQENVLLWDVKSGNILHVFKIPNKGIDLARFSPKGIPRSNPN